MKHESPLRGSSSPPQPDLTEDVVSVDAIITSLYDSISFRPGTQPDYVRLKSLFHPQGRLIPPKADKDPHVQALDVETFISRSREFVVISGLEKRGFIEKEVRRIPESFGTIVHVFSTYETRYTPADPAPLQRGINSIQLVKEGGRWWVLSVLWDIERVKVQIPPKYLA